MVILRALAAIGLASLALVAAGCGGTKSPSVASLGPATTPTTTTDSGSGSSSGKPGGLGSALKFVNCMRKHGIDVHVGNGGRSISINGGPGKSSTQMQQAQKACQKLLPGGGPKALTPAQQAKMMKQLVTLAKCMRKHGLPNFPDPTPDGGLRLDKNTLNPSSPQFQAAAKACGSTGPGGKGFGFRVKVGG